VHYGFIYVKKKKMATSKDFAEYILDQVGDERARTRAMFGEYALYYDEKVVALLCDNIVYVKQTESSEELLAENEQGHPYPGAKLACGWQYSPAGC
jgi:TfoX/Sxy family transcriptional regulator of competence genes